MINFCAPLLKPTIDCSTVCTDGYEVTNLISKDANLQRKGFMTYRAIRPPVVVTLNLLCKINVSEVTLWSEVGSQRSTGFELYAASKCNSSSSCNCKKLCSPNYDKIAYAFINGAEKGVTFIRNGNVVSSQVDYSYFVKSNFFSHKRALLCNISSLQIKIIKTASSLPCLARVEVWGQPSSSSSDVIKKQIANLWKERHIKMNIEGNVSIRKQNNTNSLKEIEDELFKIPEEFLDPITFKLMALPMTLPCGKTVDQSTLDKYEQYEATWGRPLCDPFTGKIFTNVCHPVPASSLKSRIDKFLIEHANVPEVKGTPRTTGRKMLAVAAANTSTLLFGNTSSVGENKPKRSCDSSARESNTSKKQRMDQSLTVCHEEKLNKSLCSAVKSVLAGLPSFTKFEDTKIKKVECMKCHCRHLLYKLPCDHFVCRSCLMLKQASTNMNCDVCKVAFLSADPVRHYI